MEKGKLLKENHAQHLTLAKTATPKPTDAGGGEKPTEATVKAFSQADGRSNDNIDQCDREMDDAGCLGI